MATRSTKKAPAELPEDYSVRYQLAKLNEVEQNAERLRLANVKQSLDLTKSQGNLCYIRVALDVFNGALESIGDTLRSASESLGQEIHANTHQRAIMDDFFDTLLDELVQIDLSIPTTSDTDAALDHATRAAREATRGA